MEGGWGARQGGFVVRFGNLLLGPGIMEPHRDSGEVADVARDESEAVDNRGGREQSIDNWTGAIPGPFAPEPCRGRIYAENVTRKADLYPFDPR